MSTTSQSEFGHLPNFSANSVASGLQVQKTNVSQATSITTGVTLNGSCGVVTLQSASTAAGASDTFTLTNDKIFADSVVVAGVVDYSGVLDTNGLPHISIDTVADGSCDVVVSNLAGTNALSGVLKVGLNVL